MSRPHRRAVALLGLLGAIALVAGACSANAAWTVAPAGPTATTNAVTSQGPAVTPTAPASTPSTAAESLSLTILSDTMTGKVGWPVFLHSDFHPTAGELDRRRDGDELRQRDPLPEEHLGAVAGERDRRWLVQRDPDPRDRPERLGRADEDRALDPGQVSTRSRCPRSGSTCRSPRTPGRRSRSRPGARVPVSGIASSHAAPEPMATVARWPRRAATWRAHSPSADRYRVSPL